MSPRGLPEEDFENPLVEPEDVELTDDGPRPRRTRHESEWQKRLGTYAPPAHRFQCCGTWYGAMTAQALALTRRVHCERARAHQATPRDSNG